MALSAVATALRSCSALRLIHWINRLTLEPGEAHGMAQEVDDTGLDLGLGKRRLDGLGEALQPVHDRDEDVLNAAVLEVVQNLGPELGPLVGLEPKAQDVAGAIRQDRQRDEDRLVRHGTIAADIEPDR